MASNTDPGTDPTSTKKYRKACDAAFCESTSHLFKWPTDKADSDYWCRWVKTKNVSFKLKASSRLCCKHFSEECFDNLYKYVLEFDSISISIRLTNLRWSKCKLNYEWDS